MTNVTTQCHACGGGAGQARACENSMTDAQRLAATMDGIEYDYGYDQKMRTFSDEAKAAGLVIACGESDDLLELYGALRDEVGAPRVALIDREGFVGEFDGIDMDEKRLRRYFRREPRAKTLRAIWHDKGNLCWTIETDIPHATFNIMEDGEVFGRGIVFALADLAPPVEAPADGQEAKLAAIVRGFVEKHKIGCAETIYQADRVIENAYGLIEQLADVVGYYQHPEDD